ANPEPGTAATPTRAEPPRGLVAIAKVHVLEQNGLVRRSRRRSHPESAYDRRKLRTISRAKEVQAIRCKESIALTRVLRSYARVVLRHCKEGGIRWASDDGHGQTPVIKT